MNTNLLFYFYIPFYAPPITTWCPQFICDSHPYSRLYDIQTEPKLQDSKPLLPSYNMEVSLIWEQNENHNLPN